MRFHYLDASAWVKRYVREPGTRWVNSLLTQGAAIVCSSIGPVEVVAALARTPRISQAQLERVTSQVRREMERFELLDPTRAVLRRAMDLPLVYRLRGADAVHLASAMAYRDFLGDDDELVLVSSDRELLAAASHARFLVVDPSKE